MFSPDGTLISASAAPHCGVYYTRIEVKAQMPVEQPVLDTNYKHLKIIRTLPKTTMIKTSITIAIIVAYTGENNIKYL